MIGDQEEVCPLSRRMMSQSVSPPLQRGIRFLLHPLPRSLSSSFAAVLPSYEGMMRAYHVPHVRHSGLGPFSCTGGLKSMTGENGAPVPSAWGVTASSALILDDAYEGLLLLTVPPTLAPIRLDAGRNTGPSRFRYPCMVGFIVRELLDNSSQNRPAS